MALWLASTLGLLVCLATVRQTLAQCPDPGVPSDGYLTGPVSPTYPVPAGSNHTFECTAGHEMFGNAVLTCMGSDWNNELPICTVLRNVAVFGKSSSVSSKGYTWARSKKVLNGLIDSYMVTANDDTDPWWKIDLGGPNSIEYVLITYTTAPYCISPDDDCDSVDTRLLGAVVRVGTHSDFVKNAQCGQVQATPQMYNPIVLQCSQPTEGRYVSVQLENTVGHLGFTNIQVLGLGICSSEPSLPDNSHTVSGDPPPLPVFQEYTIRHACNSGYTMHGSPDVQCVSGDTWNFPPICTKMENVAVNKAVTLSSNFNESSGTTAAVDGVLTNAFLTTLEKTPWIRIDLGVLHRVDYVYIVNRPDYGNCNFCGLRWKNMVVRVGNNTEPSNNVQCGDQIDQNTQILTEATMKCDPPLIARYVTAQVDSSSKTFFNLAEVMVFGTDNLEPTTPSPFVSTVEPDLQSTTLEAASPGSVSMHQPTAPAVATTNADGTGAPPAMSPAASATPTTALTQGGAAASTNSIGEKTSTDTIHSVSWSSQTANVGVADAITGSQQRYLPLLAILAVIPVGFLIFWYLARKKRAVSEQLVDKTADNHKNTEGSTGELREKPKKIKVAWP